MRASIYKYTLVTAALVALIVVAGVYSQRNLADAVQVTSGTRFAVTGDSAGLIIDLQGILWSLPVQGGKATALSAPLDDLRRPQLSPDGSLLVAESFATGYWNLVVMNRDGGNHQPLTTGPHDDRDALWSADGRSITFATDRGGDVGRWSVDVATGELAPLDADDQYQNLSKALHAPRPSPDNALLAWVQVRESNSFPGVAVNELVLSDLRSGAVSTVSGVDSDVFNMPPAWLDETTLLYTADGRIQQLNVISGTTTVVPFAVTLSLKVPDYTRRLPIAFAQQSQPALGIVDPVMLPGNAIVFTALGDLWLLDEDNRLQRLTDDAFVERDLSVSPDGGRLVYISDRGGSMQIWEHDLATGEARLILKDSRGPRYPTFSPDGTHIAFQEVGPRGTQDFTVHVLDTQKGKRRKLRNSPKIWPGRMAWSADGNYITVAELNSMGDASDGRNRLVRISIEGDARDVVALPDAMTVDTGPVASRTGQNAQQLALVINGSLWRLPVQADGRAAGAPEQILDALVESPGWSFDGMHIVVLGPDGLSMVDVQQGRSRARNPELEWQPARGTGRQLIHAGRLWDGTGDTWQTNVDILIEGARIVGVTPHAEHPTDAVVIDASDRSVLPGLIDHHVHFEPHRGEWVGRALLAFGITTVVEPGSLPYESREHMESWQSARRIGPRLVYAGPQLDGARRTFHFASHIESGERLQRELERGDRLGYGLIKTYRRLRPELQQQAVQGAHERGLPVTAHAAMRGIGFGGDRTEHLRGSSRTDGSSKQSDLLASYGDVRAIYGREGATLTPTLVNQGGYFDISLRAAANGESLDTIDTYAHFYDAAYRNNLNTFGRIVERRIGLVRRGLSNAGETLVELDARGVNIVAGTDSPIFPYGLALVIELQNYVDAGFSNAAALRTATANAAKAIGAAAEVGEVKPGKLADLIIVDGDPLAQIFDLVKIQGVMLNGVYRQRADILQTGDSLPNRSLGR